MTNVQSRPSELAIDIGIHPRMVNYYGQADEERPAEIFLDISYIHYMVKGTWPTEGAWKLRSQLPIHLYEILSFSSNAACFGGEGHIELAMFAGLRDVIFTFSKLAITDPRILIGCGDVSRESKRDYSIFAEPVGFQNITRTNGARVEYYPNKDYLDLWPTVQPQERLRLACGEFVRISSELFVWFHELFHVRRGHLLVLGGLGFASMKMSESQSGDGLRESGLLIMRQFEHDADTMALYNLVENIRRESGLYYHFAQLVGRENAYRLLFYAVFCTLTSLAISQSISGAAHNETHPRIGDRMLFLITFIQRAYRDDPMIGGALAIAATDWKDTCELFDWSDIMNADLKSTGRTNVDAEEYFHQVGDALVALQRFMEGSISWAEYMDALFS